MYFLWKKGTHPDTGITPRRLGKILKSRSGYYLGHRKATSTDKLLLVGTHIQRTKRASTSQIRKQFSEKGLYNVFFFNGAFCLRKMLFQKMNFPSFFQKVILVGGGSFYFSKFYLKNPNIPEYAQVIVVTSPKPNSVIALLSPHHML